MTTIWGTIPGPPVQVKEEEGRLWYLVDGLWEEERWVCHRCLDVEGGVAKSAYEQFSMGIYAGKFCDDCWDKAGYRQEYDYLDAGEYLEAEDY